MAIDRKSLLEGLARQEIAELFAGIGDASYTEEMALLARGIARCGSEVGGIDDGAGARIGKVAFDRAMAALASDGFGGERRLAKLIERVGYGQRRAGVAEDTGFADRACEVRMGNTFIAGGHVVGLPAAVVSDGRLEQMAAQTNEVPAGVVAGTDDVIDFVVL